MTESESPWAPLRYGVFRSLWLASIGSNIGTWMHTVGAAWLMTTLAASPLLVALVQTANSLPVFLLSIPAGTLADVVDRRKVLLVTQSLMLATAAMLGVVTLTGNIGPWSLLAFTFALGLGTTLNGPAWAATVPETVPRPILPAAVALNSVGFNISRAVGPALGGAIIAMSNAGAVFLLNAASFLGVITVLARWRPEGPERTPFAGDVQAALKEGVEYGLGTPGYRAILVRAGVFSFSASALWAMLPVVASRNFGDSAGYGILLGCIGAGSVIGATLLGNFRRRFAPDRVILAGTVTFACMSASVSIAGSFFLACAAMLLAGVAWLSTMSLFNVAAQATPPAGLRARALALYLLVFQGSLAVGSGLWGWLASRTTVPVSMIAAAGVMIAGGAIARWKWPLEEASGGGHKAFP